MNSTATLRYGIVGYPVAHSFSPAMHNAAFAHCKIPATYTLFEKSPGEIEGFLQNLEQENIRGLNITIPYKEKALDFVELDEESFYLHQVKAVNTLVIRGGRRHGFNTDIYGFIRAIKEHIDLTGKKVTLIGAGGAARAVCFALASEKAGRIHIFDIDASKVQGIVAMLQGIFPALPVVAAKNIGALDIAHSDIFINATPIGMKEGDPCVVREEWLHENVFVYDLIYNPPETKLLSLAKKRGLKFSNGLKMLLYQGMRSFEIWTGLPAPHDVMQKALEEELKKCLKH